ncbi:ATPase [Chlamydia sp. 12-01]|uniref:ATPase n=1 Tax=Chlamydia sp. 12-01 TaxID=3002742 RepID=UPI0035D48B5E
MPQSINTHAAALVNPKELSSVIPNNKNNHQVTQKRALTIVNALSLIGIGITLALAITVSMPSLAAAVIAFSIIAIASYIFLNRNPTKTVKPPQSITASKEVSRAPEALAGASLPSITQLLNSWIKISSPTDVDTPQFDPVDTTAVFLGWKFPNSKTTLISTCGSTGCCRFITQNLKPTIVNSANSVLYPWGDDDTRSIVRAIGSEGWKNSKENMSNLDYGQCTIGKWINHDGSNNDSDPSGPAFLAQLLGPMNVLLSNDLMKCYQEATLAYENCFVKAKGKGSKYIQVPIISADSQGPSPEELFANGSSIREQWINTIKISLIKAAQNFAMQNPDYQMIIVVVHSIGFPLLN